MSYTAVSESGVTWVDLIAPSSEDMERLKEEFPQFHPLALEDCLSALELGERASVVSIVE